MTPATRCFVLFVVFVAGCAVTASAQIVEAAGARALGMGGAFVAVANDSSATWWNPAGLATGPFFDASLAWARTEVADRLPARRDNAIWFGLGTPPFGFTYNRLRITDIRPVPTAKGPAGREDGLASVPIRSLYASQLGVTFVQSIFPGVHAGTTLKYVRGTLRSVRDEAGPDAGTLLGKGEELGGGEAQGVFDLDVGVMATGGPLRIGGVVRNLREPEFGEDVASVGPERVRIPRQFRIGVAFDAEALGKVPLTVALDADVRAYETQSGERRVVAIGAEQWMFKRRFAIRAGGRFNTVGHEERAATGGMSMLIRSGLYVDGHLVGGGAADERGWGFAARVSF